MRRQKLHAILEPLDELKIQQLLFFELHKMRATKKLSFQYLKAVIKKSRQIAGK